MADHEAIRKALAAGPTPGPWKAMKDHSGDTYAFYFDEGRWRCLTMFRGALRTVDAAHIAACNPEAISALLADRDRLAAEVEALRSFAQEMLGDWPDVGGLDGFDLQVLGVRRGLLREEIRHEPCGEYCNCAGNALESEWTPGVECYRKTPLLTGKAASPEEGTS